MDMIGSGIMIKIKNEIGSGIKIKVVKKLREIKN